MAIGNQSDHHPAPMPRDICCVNYRGLFAYLRKHHGENGVDQVLDGLVGDPRYLITDRSEYGRLVPAQKEHLEDPSVWISDELSRRILANVVKVVPGPHPLFKAGEGSVSEILSRTALMAVRLFGVGFAARQSTALNSRFNRTKTVTLTRLEKGVAELHLDYLPGFSPSVEICDWNRGIYSGLVKSTGAREVSVEETQCAVSGGGTCVFEVRWKDSSALERVKRRAMGWLLGDMAVEYERAMAERDHLIDVLGRSERRYRALFDSAGEAIIILNRETVLDCNPRTGRLFRAGRERMVGSSLLELSPRTQHDGTSSAVRLRELMDLASDGRPQYFPWLLQRRDGTPIEAEISLSRVESGEPGLLQALVHDVTERVKAERALKSVEQQLRQAQKMEAVGTLAGGIAHDFNNILAVISGYSELALEAARENATSPYEISQILKAAERAKDLVQKILVFSRKVAHRLRPMDLNQMLRDAASLIERTIPKMISVELASAPDLSPINGDATQLEQVVLNLAANSRDAMPQGGTLRLSTGNVTLGEEFIGRHPGVLPGQYVRLTVADTGLGMTPEVLSHVFEPFYTTKGVGKGTGLGLASAYGIVKGHGGEIICHSRPGQGTSFEIYLPAVSGRVAPAEGDPAQEEESYAGSETVLVVDDEAPLREIAQRILTAAGYQVLLAESGETALDVVLRGEPDLDLVLLDLGMPGMGGLRCLDLLLESRPGLPVVIASGYSHEGSLDSTVARGARTYVTKPFRRAELLGTVRKVLDGR